MPIIELATSFLINIAKDSFHNWAKKQGAGLISKAPSEQRRGRAVILAQV